MTNDLTGRGTAFLEFWRDRHLCSLTTVRPDGTAHVVPVGVTLDAAAGLARVITSRGSRKVRLLAGRGGLDDRGRVAETRPARAAAETIVPGRGSSGGVARLAAGAAADSEATRPAGVPVTVCQIDGARWSTLEGLAVVRDDPASVAEAERLYTRRYRPPRANPERVVLEISVTRVLGTV